MYCTKCGEKNSDVAIYCGRCGNKLMKEGEERQEPRKETVKEEPVQKNKKTLSKIELYRSLIEKNSDYYINEFQKIERGEKSSFNWCILFFSPIIMLYRKCYDSFLKFILPIQVIMLINMMIAKGADMNFDVGTVMMISIFNFILTIVSIGIAIYLGFNFNRLYKARIDKIIYTQRLEAAEDTYATKALIRKYGGNSVVPVLIVLGIMITLSIIIAVTGSDFQDDYSYKAPKKSTATQVSYKNDIEKDIIGTWQVDNGEGTVAITNKTFAENPYKIVSKTDNNVIIEVAFNDGSEKLSISKQDKNTFIVRRYNAYVKAYTAPTTLCRK